MKDFRSYLTETFDRPLPVREYKRLGHGPTTLEVSYHAQDDQGRDLMIDITNVGGGWEINFTLDGSHDLTHSGKPFRVLATVVKAVEMFLKWHKTEFDTYPASFDMISKRSEGKRDTVYSAMMRRFGKKYGYTITDRFTTGTPESRNTVTTAKLTALPWEKVEAAAKPPEGMRWKDPLNPLRGMVPEAVTTARLQEAREPRKALRVFDFDDTLAHTNAPVGVKRGGKRVMNLTSMRFKDYTLKPGEEYDFSAANDVVDPRPIGAVLKVLRQVLAQGKKTIILTGRIDGTAVHKWLKSIGIDIPVYTVGHVEATHVSIAQRKRDWLEGAIAQGYNDIEFWDDNEKNVQYAKTLKSQFPHIRLKTRLVKYKSRQGVHDA